MYYVFTPNYVFKLVPPLGSEPTWQTSILYSYIIPLIYVNETICMVICPSSIFKLIILWPGWTIWCQDYPKMHLMGEGPGAILSFKTFLSFINRHGNPLQSSCLEYPRDGGAWWATVSGVAQSRTQLNRLSSSSSSREFFPCKWSRRWEPGFR